LAAAEVDHARARLKLEHVEQLVELRGRQRVHDLHACVRDRRPVGALHQAFTASSSWAWSARPETPTPTRRSGPGRSRGARWRRARAGAPTRSAWSVRAGSEVERVRIAKSG